MPDQTRNTLPEMPLAQSDVYQLFRSRALASPSAIAIDENGAMTSYRALLKRVMQLASYFTERGLQAGDRVAILSRNRREYIEVELAAAATGVIVACLNWRLHQTELLHCTTLVSPKLIICEPDLAANIETVQQAPRLLIGRQYEEALAGSVSFSATRQDPETGLVILYTSGTTGLPKGAVVSHRAMIARAMVFAAELGIAPDSSFVAWAPLFHMASTDHALATLLRGGTVVIIDGFRADALCTAIANYDIGWLLLIPGMVEPFIAHLKAQSLAPKGIHVCGAMADLVPPKQIADITALLKTPYLNSFGSTETGLPPATRSIIPIGHAPDNLSKQVSAFCEVRLVDAKGNDVPDGVAGELVMRGSTLFSGYWNAPQANAESFQAGWFHMGDIFRRNPDGTLDFADRAKYMIKTGGENVYPAEIERVLMAQADVTDAAVIRVKDTHWGEVPMAYVSRSSDAVTADSLISACRETLASYKLPRDIYFIEFDDFPRSTSGKIQRHMLEAARAGSKP